MFKKDIILRFACIVTLINLATLISIRLFKTADIDIPLMILNGLLMVVALSAVVLRKKTNKTTINTITTPEISPYDESLAFKYNDELLIEYFPNILCIKDGKGRWLQASESYLRSFNILDIDYIGKTDLELAQFPDSNVLALNSSAALDNQARKKNQPTKETRTITHKDGTEEIFTIIRTPLLDTNNKPVRLILTGDFTGSAKIDRTEFELMSAIFQGSHLSYVLFDKQFRIVGINAAFTLLTEYISSQATRMPIANMIVDDIGFEPSLFSFFKEERNNGLWQREFTCRRKNGDNFPAKFDILSLSNHAGRAQYFAVLHDISQQKRNEKRILQIAHFDDLTGLANRIMFFERLVQFLSASKRHHLHAVIFFIDLDRFKAVNDSLGHDAGDELLKETARRLLAIVRKEDVVARLSGDEFAILLLNEKSHEKAIYASSMIAEKVIQSLSDMFFIQRREVFIGASIGISIYPEDGTSAEGLLKHADTAMYEAKRSGRNNYQFYKKAFTTASKDRLSMENDLRKAIAKNELCLYFQPQYRAQNNHLWGAEVLIRWLKREGVRNSKMIPPDYFIPIAEDSGLIIEIGKWILEQSCIQLKAWQDSGYPLQQLSVNISARQFIESNFLQIVEEALLKAQLEPEFLELEITESMLIGDTKRIELILNRLKKMGIKIALDDFGTGYSSLSYLKNFPIDILKIDQSFIREMTPGSKDSRIVGSIIEMGHSLGQKVVAEGVETEQQLLYLNKCNCDIIQGYYFSPPVPAIKMRTLLQLEGVNSDTRNILGN